MYNYRSTKRPGLSSATKSQAKRAKFDESNTSQPTLYAALKKSTNMQNLSTMKADASQDFEEIEVIELERDSKLPKNSSVTGKSSRSSSGCSSSSSLYNEVNSPKLSSTAKTIDTTQSFIKKPPQIADKVRNKSMTVQSSIISNLDRAKIFTAIVDDEDLEDIQTPTSYSPIYTQQTTKENSQSGQNAPSSAKSSDNDSSDMESDNQEKSVISETEHPGNLLRMNFMRNYA